jgi:hypothetical protein
MGAFGLLGHTQNDLLPTDRFVENWPAVDANDLRRRGWLTEEGSQAGLEGGGKIILESTEIRWFWHQAIPNVAVLRCPVCGAGRYKLARVSGVWCCRGCAKLDHRCRHRDRSIRGLARLRWLRKLAGADPRPFTELPAEAPPQAYWRGRRWHLRHLYEIRQIEARLLAHARDDVATVLENRLDGRRRKRRDRS